MAMYVKDRGVWLPIYSKNIANISAFNLNYVVRTNVTNLNLRNLAITLGWDGIAPVVGTVNIATGVNVGSLNTAIAAIETGTFTSGSGIVIVNNGNIVGRGGNGGNANIPTNPPNPGTAGGPAINLSYPITLINNASGLIGGGGGGGGGGLSSSAASAGGSGGGGGAGYFGGDSGAALSGTNINGNVGAIGTFNRGGAGGPSAGVNVITFTFSHGPGNCYSGQAGFCVDTSADGTVWLRMGAWPTDPPNCQTCDSAWLANNFSTNNQRRTNNTRPYWTITGSVQVDTLAIGSSVDFRFDSWPYTLVEKTYTITRTTSTQISIDRRADTWGTGDTGTSISVSGWANSFDSWVSGRGNNMISWAVPSVPRPQCTISLIGGGGSGGSGGCTGGDGGGGSSGYFNSTTQLYEMVSNVSYSIRVGAGALPDTTQVGTSGLEGGESWIRGPSFDLIAYGGQGGGGGSNLTIGGNGGLTVKTIGTYLGVSGTNGNNAPGCGTGGLTGNGNGASSPFGVGGAGVSGTGLNGGNATGFGAGGGGGTSGGLGGNGSGGFVQISYTSATQLFVGGTVTSTGTGADTVWQHRFETVGDFTFSGVSAAFSGFGGAGGDLGQVGQLAGINSSNIVGGAGGAAGSAIVRNSNTLNLINRGKIEGIIT